MLIYKGDKIMIKTFVMKVTVDTTTHQMTTETTNEGFEPLELFGVFESKKQDLLNQFYNPNDFVRVMKHKNGESEELIYKGDD